MAKVKPYREYPAGVSNAMHTWLAWCARPKTLEVIEAITAGLLLPADEDTGYTYVASEAGRMWLLSNAYNNGCTCAEARATLDYIDGA
jgi:hypothetical protein